MSRIYDWPVLQYQDIAKNLTICIKPPNESDIYEHVLRNCSVKIWGSKGYNFLVSELEKDVEVINEHHYQITEISKELHQVD